MTAVDSESDCVATSSPYRTRSRRSSGAGNREDAYFAVKEVDLGIVADLGTLQRLPGIVGYGKAAEMAVTGRRVGE
ncbi:Delta(3,5)-Delta(2,4)-dienoyl-CoA isomerase, peroxisomal-like protein [Drosera capensis]